MRPNLSFADVKCRHQMKERFSIMKNNITKLVFILDRSRSTAELESDTIGSFNSMIDKDRVVNYNADGQVTHILYGTVLSYKYKQFENSRKFS